MDWAHEQMDNLLNYHTQEKSKRRRRVQLTYLRKMDLANLQLPTTLVNSIKGFNFVEEPLWRVSQQRTTVKVEITWTLPDTNLPTNQQARAVRDNRTARRRYRPRPRRQQPAASPPPPQQQTAPPAPQTMEMPATSTVQFQRETISLPTPPSPQVRRQPMTASTPKAASPEPMEEACAANTAFILPTRPVFKHAEMISTTRHSRVAGVMEKYDQKRAFIHSNGVEGEELAFVECTPRPRPGQKPSTEPVYFMQFVRQPKNIWCYFKGPTSKHWVPEWWDFFNDVAGTTEPLHKKKAKQVKTKCRDGGLLRCTYYHKQMPRPETLPPEVTAGRVRQQPNN